MTTVTPPAIDSGGSGRRRFLAGAAGVATVALAGCLTPVASERTFGPPRERIQLDGRERHLVFGADGREVSFTLRQDAPLPVTPEPRPEWIPFHVVVHHRKGLHTDRLTLRLRAPAADGSGFDGNVYLRSPATGDSPSFTVERTLDGWTVLEAHDLGTPSAGRSIAPGESNVALDLVVNPLSSHPAEELHVEFDAELSEATTLGRRSRTATGYLTLPFVRG